MTLIVLDASVIVKWLVLGEQDEGAELGHHLFDTLYRAVALEVEGAELLTADGRYLRKAAPLSRVRALHT